MTAACDNCRAEADAPTCPNHPTCWACLLYAPTCSDCINVRRERATDEADERAGDYERENR